MADGMTTTEAIAALLKYGDHEVWCTAYGTADLYRCSCGFADVRTAARAAANGAAPPLHIGGSDHPDRPDVP
jgi:hypothetical protein